MEKHDFILFFFRSTLKWKTPGTWLLNKLCVKCSKYMTFLEILEMVYKYDVSIYPLDISDKFTEFASLVVMSMDNTEHKTSRIYIKFVKMLVCTRSLCLNWKNSKEWPCDIKKMSVSCGTLIKPNPWGHCLSRPLSTMSIVKQFDLINYTICYNSACKI